ncbi:MAG: [FeFe] hydrogenase H-cluster radical SAM maturase HydG [candidate division WOR-3 bacterium]
MNRDFINEESIADTLASARADPVLVREILARSLAKQRLEPAEAAVLLRIDQPELWEQVFAAARQLKEAVYGNRIVLFAPLYVGNYCVNNCRYCGFRRDNDDAVRRTLTDEEIRSEVRALENQGHKRLILVWGEHPEYSAEEMARVVRLVYGTKSGRGEIRRVNINAAPLDVEGYRIMKAAGIGTYQVFQETYHHETYARMHPADTPKADYLWRLTSHDRAMAGGVDDVGIGALFGLYDWRFEVLGLLIHTIHLEEQFGVGPHTISFPRVKRAHNVRLDSRYFVADEEFLKAIAVLRLAVPYTGLILTARERPEIRRRALQLGVSQIDAGSRIELGAYQECRNGSCQQLEREQFELEDTRPLDTVVRELVNDGYIPSWCTACYRLGRTGEHFMEFSRPGFIKRFCTPNALTTFVEYLTDYASAETREAGLALVEQEIERLADEKIRVAVRQRVNAIRTSDARDLYF